MAGTLFTGYASVKTSGNTFFGAPSNTTPPPGTAIPIQLNTPGLSTDMSIVSGMPNPSGPTVTQTQPDFDNGVYANQYAIGTLLDMGSLQTVDKVSVSGTTTPYLPGSFVNTLYYQCFGSVDGTTWSTKFLLDSTVVIGTYTFTTVDGLFQPFVARYVQVSLFKVNMLAASPPATTTNQVNQVYLYTDPPPASPMPPTWPGVCEGPQLTLSWLMVTNATRYVITRNDGTVVYNGALLTVVNKTVRMGTGYTYTTTAYNGATLIGVSVVSAVFVPCCVCNWTPVAGPACSNWTPVGCS